MASRGQPFNQTVIVDSSPEEVVQRALGSTAGTRDYTFNMAGPNSLVITRKFIPQWAIIVAVIGALVFLIGLLALLCKETEVLTLTATEVAEGTKVTLNGMATAELVARLNAVFQADQSVRRPASGPVVPTTALLPNLATASSACPNGHPLQGDEAFCGECGSPAARNCANGHRIDGGHKFCPECGSAAVTSTSAAEATPQPPLQAIAHSGSTPPKGRPARQHPANHSREP